MNAAQAAALLAMTARYCDRPAHAGHTETAGEAIAEADRLRHTCVALMDADGESYGGVMAARQLPKHTEEQRAARAAAIAAALVTAAGPPAEVITAAGRLLELAQTLQPMANRSIAPDVAAAAEAIRAAIATSRPLLRGRGGRQTCLRARLESTPYGVVTTLVSAAKSHQSDSRSAHEPARAALVKPECAAGAARPWPSVKQPTVHTDRRNCARRPS